MAKLKPWYDVVELREDLRENRPLDASEFAIHLDQMPAFDYDKLLWGERQIRSVANMTRQDARDFLQVAAEIGIKPNVQVFPLDRANEALQAVKHETASGPVVILP